MRKSDAVQPTAQSLIANFAPEALFKGGKQVVNRVKRGFLNKLPKSLNIFNMMAMPFLILGFGTGSAFFGGVLKCMLINGGQTKSNGDTVYLRCGSSKYHLLSPLPWAEYKAKRQIRQ